MATKSWESSVEHHMDKVGYYLEEKLPYHLNRLRKLSDTTAMENAVEAMDELLEKLVKALDAFEDSIKVSPDQEEEEEDVELAGSRLMKNPEEEEDEDDLGDLDDLDDDEEANDSGQELVDEIFE